MSSKIEGNSRGEDLRTSPLMAKIGEDNSNSIEASGGGAIPVVVMGFHLEENDSPETNEASAVPSMDLPIGKVSSNQSFVLYFLTSNGPPQVIAICLVYALGIGCILGVVRLLSHIYLFFIS